MIFAFTGKTGSGKTKKMVDYAYKEWLRGTDIYSNTVLLFEDMKRPLFWKFLNLFKKREVGKIMYFEDITEILEARNGVILFDEAQVLFNSRSWESLPKEFQYKLQQHRKHRLDLYCTTQNMGAIDITYRRLVQYWYHLEPVFQLGENPVNFGIFKMSTKDIDMLYNSIDDLKAETLNSKLFIISRLSRRLYDTFFDIGFRRLKSLCLINYSQKTENNHQKLVHQQKFLVIPKEWNLQNVRTQQLLLKFYLEPNKSQSSKKHWKS